MADTKTLSELWIDTIYNAHVNFVRKRNLMDEWDKFKAGKKMKRSDYRLMSEFIKLIEKNQEQSQG